MKALFFLFDIYSFSIFLNKIHRQFILIFINRSLRMASSESPSSIRGGLGMTNEIDKDPDLIQQPQPTAWNKGDTAVLL